MTIVRDTQHIALRSLDADWNRARWEALPPDGNRYEVIDGVLYVTTVPDTLWSHHRHLTLRSLEADWNRARWEELPPDGNRYEVIDGVLYMTTAPSSFHQWIIQEIFITLYQQITRQGKGVVMCSPIGVFMPGCSPVQPDIVVVKQEDLGIFQERGIMGVPALLIEVLSPSNPGSDRVVKRAAYARAGVPEYWIVNPQRREVLVCSQPDTSQGDYARSSLVAPDGELVSPTLPVRAPIAPFFAGAPDTSM